MQVLGPKKALQMILQRKNRLIVLKQPLRNGNLSHVLAVFVRT